MLTRNARIVPRRLSNTHIIKPISIRTPQSITLATALPSLVTPMRSMSLMPRWSPPGEFPSIFRLLDDYTDHVARRIDSTTVRNFAPRFDVREKDDTYHLDGELPGIDQKDVQIEFTDPHTLVISGRTERSYSKGTPPSSTDVGDSTTTSTTTTTNTAETKAVETTSDQETQVDTAKDNARYWITERSIGEFSRTFSFPTPVDQDNVRASLKNGVLSITVPKAKAPAGKKINIE